MDCCKISNNLYGKGLLLPPLHTSNYIQPAGENRNDLVI